MQLNEHRSSALSLTPPSPPFQLSLYQSVSRFICVLNLIQHKQLGANCIQSLFTSNVHILLAPYLNPNPACLLHPLLSLGHFLSEFWLCSLARNQKMTKAMSTASARVGISVECGRWVAKTMLRS